MADSRYLTAKQAASRLGVNLGTLYTYVSRGLIRSVPIGDDRRIRGYRSEDIQMLLDQREAQRTPGKVVENALYLGMPVIESAITLIKEGRLYYRGYDVLELTRNYRVEQVAALIWLDNLEMETSDLFEPLPDDVLKIVHLLPTDISALTLVELFQVLLSLAAAHDLASYNLQPLAVARTGARILQLMAYAATNNLTSQDYPQDVVRTLREGLAPKYPHSDELINAVLILSADHELNVTSFAVRSVASAGVTPYSAVLTGLVALQGVKHGGFIERVESFLAEVEKVDDIRSVMKRHLKRGEKIPGFGHPFYPDGDPRGEALLRLTRECFPNSAVVEIAATVAEEAYDLMGERPSIDFGLVTLSLALELPPGSVTALFALGRTIGWIGHAIEQYQIDRVIRPRAQYAGRPPRTI